MMVAGGDRELVVVFLMNDNLGHPSGTGGGTQRMGIMAKRTRL